MMTAWEAGVWQTLAMGYYLDRYCGAHQHMICRSAHYVNVDGCKGRRFQRRAGERGADLQLPSALLVAADALRLLLQLLAEGGHLLLLGRQLSADMGG